MITASTNPMLIDPFEGSYSQKQGNFNSIIHTESDLAKKEIGKITPVEKVSDAYQQVLSPSASWMIKYEK
jgi:hypothetical protein